MKFKRDKDGMVYVQIKPKERYYLLFHRINNNKYELYVKRHNEIYVFSKEEMDTYKKYIEGVEIKDGK